MKRTYRPFTIVRNIAIGIAGMVFFIPAAFAAETVVPSFRYAATVELEGRTVPTVVEVPVDLSQFVHRDFGVLEKETGVFQPWYLYDSTKGKEAALEATSKEGESEIPAPVLVDDKKETRSTFDVSEQGDDMVEILLRAKTEVAASGARLELAAFVSLPTEAEISVENEEGTERTVLARTKTQGGILRFPESSGTVWHIRMWYTQPLVIEEMSLIQEDMGTEGRIGIRFLARPGNTYIVYADPDTSVDVEMGEAGDLRANEGVQVLTGVVFERNKEYIPSDSDTDGIADIFDNCVHTANPDQKDADRSGRGDACDDFDKDGILNSADNCPDHPNRDQSDEDGDSFGDPCDTGESRLTERFPWLPWVGMFGAMGVVGALFYLTIKKPQSLRGFK